MNDIDERLQALRLVNPIVAAAFGHWRNGTISYEEALIQCVLVLAESNDQLVEMCNARPAPMEIHLTKEQFARSPFAPKEK